MPFQFVSVKPEDKVIPRQAISGAASKICLKVAALSTLVWISKYLLATHLYRWYLKSSKVTSPAVLFPSIHVFKALESNPSEESQTPVLPASHLLQPVKVVIWLYGESELAQPII